MKTLFQIAVLMVSIFSATQYTEAQWVETNGPYGGKVNTFAVSGTNLFAGTFDGGVFL